MKLATCFICQKVYEDSFVSWTEIKTEQGEANFLVCKKCLAEISKNSKLKTEQELAREAIRNGSARF